MYFLVNQKVRERVKSLIDLAPEGWIVKIEEPKRNREQNDLLHAEIQDIVDEGRKWANQTWTVEQWKRLLTAAWCRATGQGVQMVPALDGQGFDVLYQRTSDLSKRECSELIEFIRAWKETGHG